MRGRVLSWVLLLSMCSISASGWAVCDDVDALADWWDGYAVWLEGLAESGFTEAQAEQADVRMAEGLQSTRGWADFLVSQGGDVEASLGRPLHQSLNELEGAADRDTLFGALDDVIDILDAAVQRCDGGTAEAEQPAAPTPQGKIAISYYEPPEGYLELAQGLRDSGVYETVAETVSSAVALPHDLPVDFAACGQANAFYDPGQRRITMCYEFFGLFASVFAGDDVGDDEFAESVLGAGAFFLLHEIGHALVHLFEIPITGREEDSVDSLATLILIHGEGQSALFAAIDNFGAMADSMGDAELPFWDEHSLNQQRLYDVACLIFGSNPEAYAGMVGHDALPEERAVRCPAEFQQKNQAWDVLLAPYFIE